MNLPLRTIAIYSALVVAFLVSAFAYSRGYKAGVARGRADACSTVDWNGSKAQTNDAIRRWLRKAGAREMTGRYSCVMVFPNRNCIQFRLETGWVGGEPTYCYRANTMQLIEEDSDVE